MNRLPEPNQNAKNVADVVEIILDSIPWIGPAVKVYVRRSQENARGILLEELASSGMSALNALTDGQKEFLVPAGYRFFEQARLGEYEYNLRTLASIMSGEVQREHGDVGVVARSARRLEMATFEELRCIASLGAAMSIHQSRHDDDPVHRSFFSVGDLHRVVEDPEVAPSHLLETMNSLSWRGIVVPDREFWPGNGAEAAGFRPTAAFDEICMSVTSVVKRSANASPGKYTP